MQTHTRIVLVAACAALLACAAPTRRPSSDSIHASQDSALVERGRQLAYGAAHCADCHGDPARVSELRNGSEVPLTGGKVFDLGLLGKMVAPNITSDREAGIGALSDDDLVRSLRYGFSSRHGRPLAPFMAFANLTDEDLRAILSFLRAQAPDARRAPPHELSWIGDIGVSVLLAPQRPAAPPPERLVPANNAEYGRYLAHTVANCYGCHTERSKFTGAFVGVPFAGGMMMRAAGSSFVTPDLRPVRTWGERRFIERFRRLGRTHDASPMPWEAYARMTDTELGAIYRYLASLPSGEE